VEAKSYVMIEIELQRPLIRKKDSTELELQLEKVKYIIFVALVYIGVDLGGGQAGRGPPIVEKRPCIY